MYFCALFSLLYYVSLRGVMGPEEHNSDSSFNYDLTNAVASQFLAPPPFQFTALSNCHAHSPGINSCCLSLRACWRSRGAGCIDTVNVRSS